jgi:hypothetical protein
VEDLLPVRPSDHEAEEPAHLVVAQAHAFPHVFAVGADLALHDIAQAEAARHGARGILVLEKLSREITVANDLEEPECNDGLHPSRTVRGSGTFLGNAQLGSRV